MTAIQSDQLNTANPSQGTWNQQNQLGTTLDGRGNVVGGVDATALLQPSVGGRRDDAIAIDGNATNEGTRQQTQSSTGQPLFVDTLDSTAGVQVTRERTAELDQRTGQYFVQADQLVFTTGSADDQVKVTQGDNGALSFDVNGEQYDVELAQGQQLTIRTGDGSDTIDIDPSVQVNFIIEAGAGNDSVQGGGGNDRIDGGTGNDTIDTGGGFNYVFGGSGDDRIVGGNDDNTLYGGDGADTITGGTGTDYIELSLIHI